MSEPRQSPGKRLEQAAGFSGALFLLSWLVVWVCRLLDWIGRAQTIVTLDPYLHWLVTWWGSTIELFLAVILFVYATRLEQVREDNAASRIIRPGNNEPPQPNRRWFWAKLVAWVAAFSFVVVVGVFLWIGSLPPTPPSVERAHYTTPVQPLPLTPKTEHKRSHLPHTTSPRQTRSGSAEFPKPSQSNPQAQATAPLFPPNVSNEDSQILCPQNPSSGGWTLSDQMHLEYSLPRGLHPVLQASWHSHPIQVPAAKLKNASALFAEVQSQLPKLQSLTALDGPIQIEQKDFQITHSLAEPTFLNITYSRYTAKGLRVSDEVKQTPIASLSSDGQALVADLDQLANSEAEKACKDVVHQLSAK